MSACSHRGKMTSGNKSNVTQAFAKYGDRHFTAWTGTDGHLNVAEINYTPPNLAGGPRFEEGGQVRLGETSSHSPALAAFNPGGGEALFLAWTGTDGRLNLLRSSDPLNAGSWGEKETLDEFSIVGPVLTDQGFLIWTGQDNRLNYSQWICGFNVR